MLQLNVQLGLLFVTLCFYISGVDPSCEFTTYEEYITTWNNRYYTEAQKLYPYGETYCDQNVTIQIGFNPRIQFPVYFYGVKYLSLWVSPHGVISLNTTTQPNPVLGYVFQPSWPNENYPDTADVPFIAPFYSEVHFQPSNRPNDPARLSYRVLDPTQSTPDNAKEITTGMLNALSVEIRNAVVGADDFVAEFGLVITWHKITFGASYCSTTAENCVRNTYQTALVVSGSQTYVVYNYFDIRWVGGAGYQRCDPNTGLSSTSYPNCHAAYIGFNAGYGRHFYGLPYSNDVDQTKNIDIKSGSTVVGRFIYSVAGDRILRGGCTNDTNNLDNSVWPLEAVPVSTDMIGGVAVDISAPCFHQNMLERTKCSFGGVETDLIRNPHTTMKATCVPPQLSVVGSTDLALIVDGTAKFYTLLLINLPGRNPPKVQLTLANNDWLNPAQIQITWDPNDLKDTSGTVDIVLSGYREGDNSENIWERLEVLADMQSNSGSFSFTPDSFQCGSGMAAFEKCLQYHIGAIQVADHRDDHALSPKSLCSEVIPLGWYVQTAVESEYGTDWAAYVCQEWDYLEQRNGGWSDRDALPACPCTLQQALFDYGRYQPDAQCQLSYTGRNKCRYNIGAKHCVVSMYSTPSQASGSRCCYGSDDLLLYSGDSMYGSCPDRSHDWGQYPYSASPRVPSLSHWMKDLAPWYYCCQWQENKEQCYSIYLANRRTSDCQQYQSPGFASSFGDPHFSTFDGTTYTFNGHGEFWLMTVTDATLYGQNVNFHVQVRMNQPPEHIWGAVQATITTAVAVKLDRAGAAEGQIITFVIDEFYINSDNKLLVYVDDHLLDFFQQEAQLQEFTDFIIVNHDPPQSKAATNFTVAFRLGVGVRVSFHNGLIQTMISAPPEFKYKSNGLVGQWNDDPADDLLPRGGSSPVPPDDMQNVHQNFGLTWMIVNSESMFEQVYRARMDYYFYRDENFLPEFTPVAPEPNASSWNWSPAAAEICSNNQACLYDYTVTASETVAMETKLTQERWEEVRQLSSKVQTCGWLSIPHSIKKGPYNYLVGSVVIVEGCLHNYNLEGPSQYTCRQNGEDQPSWDPRLATTCVNPDAGLSPALITAIAIPSAILLFLLIIGIVILVIWMNKRRNRGKPTRPSEMDSNYIDDSFSQALPPVKTAGKPRPNVNTSYTYSSDNKDDTASSFEKASLSSKELPSESTYTDMSKGSSKKKKRQKSANLDDSISIESDEKSNSRDRLNIDFEKEVIKANKRTNHADTKQKPREQYQSSVKVSYKPEPSWIRTQPGTALKQPHVGAERNHHSRHQPSPPVPISEVRKAPYQYPRSHPDILAGPGPGRPSPYYNPPSPPQQRKRPPYVYPRKEN